MNKIDLPQLQRSLEVQPNKTVMQHLLEAKIPVASSCGGEGVCGKCKVIVLSSDSTLTAPTETEKLTSRRLKIQKGERLSCQCSPLKDLQIKTTYW